MEAYLNKVLKLAVLADVELYLLEHRADFKNLLISFLLS